MAGLRQGKRMGRRLPTKAEGGPSRVCVPAQSAGGRGGGGGRAGGRRGSHHVLGRQREGPKTGWGAIGDGGGRGGREGGREGQRGGRS